MNIVLRASSSSLDLDRCLEWIPQALLVQSWRIGEADLRKRPVETNGFTLGLADEEVGPEALQSAFAAIETLKVQIAGLVGEGVQVRIDFGLFVTASVPQVLVLLAHQHKLLADLGVDIVVHAYPSDEE